DTGRLRLRSFRFQRTDAALGEDSRRDRAARIVRRDALRSTVIGNSLANISLREIVAIVHARIDIPGADKAGLVSLELFEQRRRAIRSAIRAAEAKPTVDGPIAADLVGPVPIVLIAESIVGAGRLHVGDSSG